MKKIISLILVVIVLTSFTSCFKPSYTWGDTSDSWGCGNYVENIKVKVTSDKLCFNKEDVTLDIFTGLYDLKVAHLLDGLPEELRENYKLAVYASNNIDLLYEIKKRDSVDIENVEGAKLIKSFSYDEVFFTDFGYSKDGSGINYNHKDTITIPKEFYNSNNEAVYIYVIDFLCRDSIENDLYNNGKHLWVFGYRKICLEYRLLGDYVIIS